ncbi:hypothetical protein [Lewinella sp. IMCC34183]|uniref:hypothetical protein n=1 Tax=Lewinella sp. IMCC34183 TaxID=2248762 RepID=UPI000E24F786|nr:hypothetical protein [Lewinella sp. IMCC34183]
MSHTYLVTLNPDVDPATWSAPGVRIDRVYVRLGVVRIRSARSLRAADLPGAAQVEPLRSFRAEEE